MKKNVKQSAALYAAVVCLSVCLSVIGCQYDMGSSQNMGQTGALAEGRKIEQIMFKVAKNSDLTEDITGYFKYPKTWKKSALIYFSFPAGTDNSKLTSLIPEFTASYKAELFYDRGKDTSKTKLKSGETPINVSVVPNDIGTNFNKGNFITVKAENGETFIYKLMSEIDLPNAEQTDIDKYAGSYYGETPEGSPMGKNKVVAVFEKEKVTLYTTADGMSMDYSNVEWEKDGDKVWCVTYQKEKPKVKNLYGKLGFTFEETGGKTNVKGTIMRTPVTLEKGDPFVWTEGCEYSKVNMHI